MTETALARRIAARAATLSPGLQEAAAFAAAHPLEIASRSLRSVAALAERSPATFSRLARALGFESYEALRESCRAALAEEQGAVAARARRLRREAEEDAAPLLTRHVVAALEAIAAQALGGAADRCAAAASLLGAARRVLVIGDLSSAPLATYAAHLAGWVAEPWSVLEIGATSAGAALTGLDARDAALVIAQTPFSRRSIAAAAQARAQGARSVVITDSAACPALSGASVGFVTAADGPPFFASHAATIVLIEALITALLAEAGEEGQSRLAAVEATQRRLGAYWTP